MTKKILEIYCRSCGAPAKFDIIRQQYSCLYCGGKVEIEEAKKEKQGFRQISRRKVRENLRHFQLVKSSCPNCGAGIVIEENEALSSCPFCGTSMVRGSYAGAADLPEGIIPFALTPEEAEKMLADWCRDNRNKNEAKQLKSLTGSLQGYYLPYMLVHGPADMTVSRIDGMRKYRCRGFINDEFVNCSAQLDNLLLDGMEPFDTDALREFDFSYTSGQRVKISDLSDDRLEKRTAAEASSLYVPAVRKVLETKAAEVVSDVSSAFILPVLLPVYFICRGNLMAAVNGQTGKVSVRALKDSHYFFIPWWLKSILSTLAFSLLFFGAFIFSGMPFGESLMISLMLAAFLIIVTLCYFSDTAHTGFSVVSGRKIFTSGEQNFVRREGELVLSDRILERKIYKPVFFENLDGKETPVKLRFTTPLRVLKIAALCFTALFLPVIFALLINGFNFRGLNLGGSAVWFCIAVPVVPVYLLKYGIQELHDNPWIYIIGEDGSEKRYRKKFSFKISRDTVSMILYGLFVPPASLAVWFAIASFIVMVYLTAFGFD